MVLGREFFTWLGRTRGALVPLCIGLGLILGAASGEGKRKAEAFESHAGELLVAAESMPDPRFKESVILMVRHGADGAMGLIVNRPMATVPLGMLFDDAKPRGDGFKRKFRVYFGGPVEPNKGFVVHRRDYAIDGTLAVKNGYAVTSNQKVIEALGEGTGPAPAAIAFGYAGWGAGQLEGEIARGDWYWIPAEEALIFGEKDSEKWRRALAKRGLDL